MVSSRAGGKRGEMVILLVLLSFSNRGNGPQQQSTAFAVGSILFLKNNPKEKVTEVIKDLENKTCERKACSGCRGEC